jgi:hypothetical protein
MCAGRLLPRLPVASFQHVSAQVRLQWDPRSGMRWEPFAPAQHGSAFSLSQCRTCSCVQADIGWHKPIQRNEERLFPDATRPCSGTSSVKPRRFRQSRERSGLPRRCRALPLLAPAAQRRCHPRLGSSLSRAAERARSELLAGNTPTPAHQSDIMTTAVSTRI